MATGGGGRGGGGEGIEDYLSEINDMQEGTQDGGTGQSDDELSKTPEGKSHHYRKYPQRG